MAVSIYKRGDSYEKKLTKQMGAAVLAGVMVFGMSMTSFAGEWKHDGKGWWYQELDGTYPKSESRYEDTTSATSRWIDGDGDGIAELYYFDQNGYMMSNKILKSGYGNSNMELDANGAALKSDGSNEVLTKRVEPCQLPQGGLYNFLKPQYRDTFGKDQAYVESVLGAGTTDDDWYYTFSEISRYYGDVRIDYRADIASYFYGNAGDLFNYEKDSYTVDELDAIFGTQGEDCSYLFGGGYVTWSISEAPSIHITASSIENGVLPRDGAISISYYAN